MRTPRGLRSNSPSVHIDKDRGFEAIILSRPQDRLQIEREIEAGIERMQRDLGIKQETHTTLYHVGGYLMAAAIAVCSVFIFAVKAKAQNPTFAEMIAPTEFYCTNSQEFIRKQQLLYPTRKPIPVSGPLAREISNHVFNVVPPAFHIILFPMPDGGTILVPCGPNNQWLATDAVRIEIDMTFQRDLENPKTEITEQKRTRRPK